MGTVLIAWELGSGLGHLDRMRMVAAALRGRGHRVVLAPRDLSRAHARVAADGFELLQAPLWLPPMRQPPRLHSYATVLAAAGWMDAAGLAGLLRAWRGLFDLLRPDALVADHAPTAVLAARGRALPVFCLGNPFEVPPLRADGFPPLAWWGPPPEGPDDSAALLASVQRGQALAGDAPAAQLGTLAELFAPPVQRGLFALPTLGHYPPGPGDAPSLGPMYRGDGGQAPTWPAGPGPRVFVYLSAEHAAFPALLRGIAASGAAGLVHASGVDVAAASALAGPRCHLAPLPVQVDLALQEADVVVTHGSIGTVTAAALAGRPQLVLPRHMEQRMVSQRVVDAGVGLMATLATPEDALHGQLQQLLAEPGWRAAAVALAARHAGESPAASAQRAAALIEPALA